MVDGYTIIRIVFGIIVSLMTGIIAQVKTNMTDKNKQLIYLFISIFFLIVTIPTFIYGQYSWTLYILSISGIIFNWWLYMDKLIKDSEGNIEDSEDNKKIKSEIIINHILYNVGLIIILVIGAFLSKKATLLNKRKLTPDELSQKNHCINKFGGPVIVQELAEKLKIIQPNTILTIKEMPNICDKIIRKINNPKYKIPSNIIQNIKDIIKEVQDDDLITKLMSLLPTESKSSLSKLTRRASIKY